MQRRTLIKAAAAVPLGAGPSGGRPAAHCGNGVVWQPIVPVPAGIPALDGFTDTVPDIVGRLGVPIDLAIFTEGNHFPVLLGGEIIVPFRNWARRQPRYAALALDNIVVVTLPQSMIAAILLGGGLALGNMTLAVSRASGFYPDIVMSGAAPLARLRQAAIVAGEARVFARDRGLSLLVAAGNPLAIRGLADVATTGARVVLASETEKEARHTYLATVEALIGRQSAQAILARETTSFPGRLGIQHRDVLQAIATGKADVGIIVHHLARYFAETYPHDCTMVAVPGADRFSSTLAMVAAADPLRPEAARAFSEFFLDVAREVYPRYGFALIAKTEFGEPIRLE